MNGLRVDQVALVAAGSGLVVAGASLAGLYAFADRVEVVFVGILLFGTGYRVTQHGQYRTPEDPLLPTPAVGRARSRGDGSGATAAGRAAEGEDRTVHRADQARRYALGIAGLFGIALGVTLFAQTIVDPSAATAVASGLVSLGGYISAHVGINGELL